MRIKLNDGYVVSVDDFSTAYKTKEYTTDGKDHVCIEANSGSDLYCWEIPYDTQDEKSELLGFLDILFTKGYLDMTGYDFECYSDEDDELDYEEDDEVDEADLEAREAVFIKLFEDLPKEYVQVTDNSLKLIGKIVVKDFTAEIYESDTRFEAWLCNEGRSVKEFLLGSPKENTTFDEFKELVGDLMPENMVYYLQHYC